MKRIDSEKDLGSIGEWFQENAVNSSKDDYEEVWVAQCNNIIKGFGQGGYKGRIIGMFITVALSWWNINLGTSFIVWFEFRSAAWCKL